VCGRRGEGGRAGGRRRRRDDVGQAGGGAKTSEREFDERERESALRPINGPFIFVGLDAVDENTPLIFVGLAAADENSTQFRRSRGRRKYLLYFRGPADENLRWPTKIGHIFVDHFCRRK
jgi:hypothetical protein